MLDLEKKEELLRVAIYAAEAVFTALQEVDALKRDALAVRALLINDHEGPEHAITEIFGERDKSKWDHPFDEIAAGKERITARTLEPSRVIQTQKQHLLRGNDVKFWGNAIDDDRTIIVSCSGVQPWIDELISQIIVSTYLALVENEVEKAREAEGNFFNPTSA